MKVALESTQQIVTLAVGPKEVEARVWIGHTESGIPVQALIMRVSWRSVASTATNSCASCRRNARRYRRIRPSHSG